MLSSHTYLWDTGQSDLAKGVSPDFLAAAHPVWEFDVQGCAPWAQETGPELEGREQRLWRGGCASPWPVVVCGQAGSALDVAWALAEAGWLGEFGAVLAISQSKGRGQLRRPWHSPPGNLHAAWVWPELAQPWDRLASILAGYALCAALRQEVPGALLKWPNDLLLEDHKVGGMLVEERKGRAVVGFGLNLVAAPPPGDMRADAATPAGYLNTLCAGYGPLRLWLRLAQAAAQTMRDVLAEDDPFRFLVAAEDMLAWRGLRVRVRTEDGGELSGVLAGLAQDGGLRLNDVEGGAAGGGGEQILYSGSILPLY